MMTGLLVFAAASRHALTLDDETQLTAGMAKPEALAHWKSSRT